MDYIEEWRFVPAYEGLYMVSNKGRVINCRTGKILKPGKDKDGYLQVHIFKDGKSKRFYVHRLVALAFIPNPENLPCVNHKDENKQNNCVENLEWCTNKYNLEYSGIIEKFQKAGTESIKTPIEVYKNGELVGVFCSQIEAARQLGLDKGNIGKVLKGKYSQTGGYSFKYANKDNCQLTLNF